MPGVQRCICTCGRQNQLWASEDTKLYYAGPRHLLQSTIQMLKYRDDMLSTADRLSLAAHRHHDKTAYVAFWLSSPTINCAAGLLI